MILLLYHYDLEPSLAERTRFGCSVAPIKMEASNVENEVAGTLDDEPKSYNVQYRVPMRTKWSLPSRLPMEMGSCRNNKRRIKGGLDRMTSKELLRANGEEKTHGGNGEI